jgi:hypothetical protein
MNNSVSNVLNSLTWHLLILYIELGVDRYQTESPTFHSRLCPRHPQVSDNRAAFGVSTRPKIHFSWFGGTMYSLLSRKSLLSARNGVSSVCAVFYGFSKVLTISHVINLPSFQFLTLNSISAPIELQDK